VTDGDLRVESETAHAPTDQDLLAECLYVNEVLEAEGIEHVFIKTLNKPDPGDVDILVSDDAAFERAHEAFADRGYDVRVSDRYYRAACVRSDYESVEEIDIHSKVSWGTVVCLEEIETVEYVSVGDRELPVPGPLDDLLVHTAHVIFGKKDVTPYDYQHYAATRARVDFDDALRRAAAYGWAWALRRLDSYLRGHDETASWRVYKLAYVLPVGLLLKTAHESRDGAVIDAGKRITSYFIWKLNT
jgi:hypothetical protein